jgi:hypothetical protein
MAHLVIISRIRLETAQNHMIGVLGSSRVGGADAGIGAVAQVIFAGTRTLLQGC